MTGVQSVLFRSDDPDNFESALEEVGSDERVLSEETELSVGTRFGGQDKWR